MEELIFKIHLINTFCEIGQLDGHRYGAVPAHGQTSPRKVFKSGLNGREGSGLLQETATLRSTVHEPALSHFHFNMRFSVSVYPCTIVPFVNPLTGNVPLLVNVSPTYLSVTHVSPTSLSLALLVYVSSTFLSVHIRPTLLNTRLYQEQGTSAKSMQGAERRTSTQGPEWRTSTQASTHNQERRMSTNSADFGRVVKVRITLQPSE